MRRTPSSLSATKLKKLSRRCSPSVTMSTPALSCARRAASTASSAMTSNCSAEMRPCCLSRRARRSCRERGQLPTVVTGNKGSGFVPLAFCALSNCALLEVSLVHHGLREVAIAGGTARKPRLEAFHVHHLAVLGVVIAHRIERSKPSFCVRFGEGGKRRKVAVVERVGGSQHPECVGWGRAVA